MKKTLIAAAAVAATSLAVPVVSQADSHAKTTSKLVGSLRYGFAYADPGGDADADLSSQNFGSRIIWSGSSDLGTGTTAFANLELRLNDARNANVVNRKYRVGLKGDFGKVSWGIQDTAIDLVTPDRTWWNGGSGYVTLRNEKPGAVKYENSFGDIKLAAAIQAAPNDDDNDVADVFDVAVKYSANGVTLGAGVQTQAGNGDPVANDGTAFQVVGGYNFGAGDITIGFGVADEDFTGGAEVTGIEAQAAFGDIYAWFGSRDNDGGANPTRIGLGYTQKIGPQALLWYELFSDDPDTDGSDNTLAFNMALKIDF